MSNINFFSDNRLKWVLLFVLGLGFSMISGKTMAIGSDTFLGQSPEDVKKSFAAPSTKSEDLDKGKDSSKDSQGKATSNGKNGSNKNAAPVPPAPPASKASSKNLTEKSAEKKSENALDKPPEKAKTSTEIIEEPPSSSSTSTPASKSGESNTPAKSTDYIRGY